MLQLDGPQPDQPDQPPTPSPEERDHALRNALSVARLQVDVLRRRVDGGRYDGTDLDGALARVRGAIDRALDLMTDELIPSQRTADPHRKPKRQ